MLDIIAIWECLGAALWGTDKEFLQKLIQFLLVISFYFQRQKQKNKRYINNDHLDLQYPHQENWVQEGHVLCEKIVNNDVMHSGSNKL